jgi:hypothetical protein
MTLVQTTTATLRRTLAALLITATAVSATLPSAALAKSELIIKDRLSRNAEQVENTGKRAEAVSKYSWKCGYVIKRKNGKYKPKHVVIKKYKTQVNCYEVLKGKKPIVVRGFKFAVKDSAIRKSVSDSANRL